MEISKIHNSFFKTANKLFGFKKSHYLHSTISINNPQGVAVDREGGRILVTNIDLNKITVLDYKDQSIILGEIPNINRPYDIVLDKTANRFIVAGFQFSGLYFIDYDTLSVSGVANGNTNIGVDVDPEGNRIFTSLSNVNQVQVLNYTTKAIITTLNNGINAPRGIAVDRPSGRIFTLNQGASNFQVREYNDPSIVLQTVTTNTPISIEIDFLNGLIYVVNIGNATITVFKYSDLSVKKIISTTDGNFSSPRFLTLDSYMNRILIPNGGSNSISIIK